MALVLGVRLEVGGIKLDLFHLLTDAWLPLDLPFRQVDGSLIVTLSLSRRVPRAFPRLCMGHKGGCRRSHVRRVLPIIG